MTIKSLEDIVYAILLGETEFTIPNLENLIEELLADDTLERINKIISKLYDRNS